MTAGHPLRTPRAARRLAARAVGALRLVALAWLALGLALPGSAFARGGKAGSNGKAAHDRARPAGAAAKRAPSTATSLGAAVAGKDAAATPVAATSLTPRQARREVMRRAGIPTSQQPVSQMDPRGTGGVRAGRQYTYRLPRPGGGEQEMSVQQALTDRDHGPHWEAGRTKPGGQRDGVGRPRLTSGKAKVEE